MEPVKGEIPRLDNSKDPLYNGTLKVVLSTSLQQQLMNDGFRIVGERLQEEKLMQQSIIFFLLIGGTVGGGHSVALLSPPALAITLHRIRPQARCVIFHSIFNQSRSLHSWERASYRAANQHRGVGGFDG